MTLLPMVTAWIAILLVTDNCTRQCLGLPLFMAGSHGTAIHRKRPGIPSQSRVERKRVGEKGITDRVGS